MGCALCLPRVARNSSGIRQAPEQARAADISREDGPEAESQRTGGARNEAVYLPALDDADAEPENDDQRDQGRKVLDADTQSKDNPG